VADTVTGAGMGIDAATGWNGIGEDAILGCVKCDGDGACAGAGAGKCERGGEGDATGVLQTGHDGSSATESQRSIQCTW
jgi:hypothetical protein